MVGVSILDQLTSFAMARWYYLAALSRVITGYLCGNHRMIYERPTGSFIPYLPNIRNTLQGITILQSTENHDGTNRYS